MAKYSADTIAKFLLSQPSAEDNDISNLKLQKLCYYAQGLVTAMRGEPLFEDAIEAWDHGPVIPALYHQYKSYGSGPIAVVTDFDLNKIAAEDRQALSDIYEYYGQYSPWRLRNMTHEEKPWIDAYKSSKQITTDALLDFFKPQVDEDYASGIYGKLQ